MDYRAHDQDVWETIFRQASDAWLTAPPSDLMNDCASFFRDQGVSRVLDLGSGFGRWTHFVSRRAACSVVGVDYALGGSRLGCKLAPPSSRASFQSRADRTMNSSASWRRR